MKQYAYRIYKNTPSHPIIGGTISADTMEQATQKVIASNGVQVVHETRHGQEYHTFTRDGVKVGILLYIRPEDY